MPTHYKKKSHNYTENFDSNMYGVVNLECVGCLTGISFSYGKSMTELQKQMCILELGKKKFRVKVRHKNLCTLSHVLKKFFFFFFFGNNKINPLTNKSKPVTEANEVAMEAPESGNSLR